MTRRCGKRRYRDQVAAMIALADTDRRGKRPNAKSRDELRVYRCGNCRGWHLTSEPKNEVAS